MATTADDADAPLHHPPDPDSSSSHVKPVVASMAPESQSQSRWQSLQPWEQHGGVINMPRFLYSSDAAPVLHRSGFLITCSFQREKSATKEAMDILHQYLGISEPPVDVDIEPDAKRARTGTYTGSTVSDRKSPNATTVGQEPQSEESEATTGEGKEQTSRSEVQDKSRDAIRADALVKDGTRNGLGKGICDAVTGGDRETALSCSPAVEEKRKETSPDFQLVKLARKGLVYISTSRRPPGELVTFFSKLLIDFHSEVRPSPRWCHRIFPVQATCLWTKQDVQNLVSTLVREFAKDHDLSDKTPVKYAVAVNMRGFEDTISRDKVVGSTNGFDKFECIKAVAETVENCAASTSVDLTNPQMVVMVEVLPLVRVVATACAVSIMPRQLVSTKPKLQIQSLVPSKKQEQFI